MFGLISKKKVLKMMDEIKSGNKATDLYEKYPPKNEHQEKLNCYSQGYEDGADNFYNGLKYLLK